jgi:preprotein translocase subunit Sss1
LATFVSYGMGFEVVGIVTYIISMISLGKLSNIYGD